MERGYFKGDFERKVIFYQKTLSIGDSERYVKENSGKWPRLETWREGGSF
jgi:hypothetical protein